jgi:DNA-binding CsgD family transcriptional regulator
MSSRITLKEQRIIALVADGLINSEIAKIIGTTENVVKNYLRTIFDKTGTWTRLELALWHLKSNDPPQFDQTLVAPWLN